MINQKFDILNKPVLSCYNAAYLVDYKMLNYIVSMWQSIIVAMTYIGLMRRLKGQSLMINAVNYYYIITKDILESATGTYYLQHLVLV